MKERRLWLGERVLLAAFGIGLALALAGSYAQAAAPSVVNVSLQDTSTDPAVKSMKVVVDHASAAAGKVTFRAVNQSKNTVHELLVVRMKPGQTTLPYDDKEQEVAEKGVQRMGEIDNIKPGAKRSMTLTLKPGSYVLLCNEPGHYKDGMSTPFTVTK